MSDLVTTLRHSSCRASESLHSYLRASASTASQLSEVQSRLAALQAERATLKTDDEVNALLAAVRSSSASVLSDLESKLRASQDAASQSAASLARARQDLEAFSKGRGEEAARLEREREAAVEAERRAAEAERARAAADVEALRGDLARLGTANEGLTLANTNQARSIIEQNIAIGRLNEMIDDLKGKGQRSNDDASKYKELEAKLRKEIEGLKRDCRTKDEEFGKAKEDLRASSNLVGALKEEIESLKKDVAREKKGREVSEREVRTNMELHQSRLSELRSEHASEVRSLEARIAALEEELEKLRDVPKEEPMPDASKFKMYVDLKAENSKLSKQLQKTKELNEKIVAGGMAARRKASTEAAQGASFFSATVEEGREGRTERRPSFDNPVGSRKKFPEEVGSLR